MNIKRMIIKAIRRKYHRIERIHLGAHGSASKMSWHTREKPLFPKSFWSCPANRKSNFVREEESFCCRVQSLGLKIVLIFQVVHLWITCQIQMNNSCSHAKTNPGLNAVKPTDKNTKPWLWLLRCTTLPKSGKSQRTSPKSHIFTAQSGPKRQFLAATSMCTSPCKSLADKFTNGKIGWRK